MINDEAQSGRRIKEIIVACETLSSFQQLCKIGSLLGKII